MPVMVHRNFRLTTEVSDLLDRVAAFTGRNASLVVREALAEHLKQFDGDLPVAPSAPRRLQTAFGNDAPEWLTAEEMADEFATHPRVIEDWSFSGRGVVGVPMGGSLWFSRAAVDKWLSDLAAAGQRVSELLELRRQGLEQFDREDSKVDCDEKAKAHG